MGGFWEFSLAAIGWYAGGVTAPHKLNSGDCGVVGSCLDQVLDI